MGRVPCYSKSFKQGFDCNQPIFVRFVDEGLQPWIVARPVTDCKIQRRIEKILVNPAINEVKETRAETVGWNCAPLQDDASVPVLPDV